MEWCVDQWLVYRTEADLRTLLIDAGFERTKVSTQMDTTGSLVLASVAR